MFITRHFSGTTSIFYPFREKWGNKLLKPFYELWIWLIVTTCNLANLRPCFFSVCNVKHPNWVLELSIHLIRPQCQYIQTCLICKYLINRQLKRKLLKILSAVVGYFSTVTNKPPLEMLSHLKTWLALSEGLLSKLLNAKLSWTVEGHEVLACCFTGFKGLRNRKSWLK